MAMVCVQTKHGFSHGENPCNVQSLEFEVLRQRQERAELQEALEMKEEEVSCCVISSLCICASGVPGSGQSCKEMHTFAYVSTRRKRGGELHA